MEIKWQSEDGYVVVADGVRFPDEEGEGPNDLEALFKAGAWIVIWRAMGGQDGYVPEHMLLWHITRNRRHPKPSLLEIKRLARAEYGDDYDLWGRIYVYGAGGGGKEIEGGEIDPIALAQSIYRRWGELAARALPARLEWIHEMRPHISADEFHWSDVAAWMRPGIPLHRERRQLLRELAEEIAAE